MVEGLSIQKIAIAGSVAFFGALGVFLLAAMFPEKMMIVAGFFVNHFVPQRYREMILGFAEKFLEGLQSLRSPKEVLMIFATSVVIWLLETANTGS